MKNAICFLFILCMFAAARVAAQKARVGFITSGYRGDVHVFDPAVNYDPAHFLSIIHLDKSGRGSYTTDIVTPRYVLFYFADERYCLFLSPGDDLVFNARFAGPQATVAVTGRGSNNNQPAIFALTNLNTRGFKNDKTPYRAIAAIKKQEANNALLLKQYIGQYKPSAAFIKNAQWNNQYFALRVYHELYFITHSPYKINPDDDKWLRIKDSLFTAHLLNNNQATGTYNYDRLTEDFLMRQEELLGIRDERQHRAAFYHKWYHTTVAKGQKIYANEVKNIFCERIISKYFSGKSAEHLYAHLLRDHFRFSDYKNLDLVFAHFKLKFPSSRFIPVFAPAMVKIAVQQKQTLNSKMLFVADNGVKLNTLADVKKLMKGKTVLVDMWGTWCGPCRLELEKYTPAIRDHFKDKDLLFLYIANKDIDHLKEWKRVISYYKIEGTHILANQNLDADIMTQIRSTGYPTHFMIKKDGSFIKLKIQDEAHTQAVINEIAANL